MFDYYSIKKPIYFFNIKIREKTLFMSSSPNHLQLWMQGKKISDFCFYKNDCLVIFPLHKFTWKVNLMDNSFEKYLEDWNSADD